MLLNQHINHQTCHTNLHCYSKNFKKRKLPHENSVNPCHLKKDILYFINFKTIRLCLCYQKNTKEELSNQNVKFERTDLVRDDFFLNLNKKPLK